MMAFRVGLLAILCGLCVVSLRRDCNYINFANNDVSPYIMKGHPLDVCLGYSVNEVISEVNYVNQGGMKFVCQENNTAVYVMLYNDDKCTEYANKQDVTESFTFPGINTTYGDIPAFTYNTTSWECNLSSDCEYFEYTIFRTTSSDGNQCTASSDTWYRTAFLSNACVDLEDTYTGTTGSGYYSCNEDDGSLKWTRYYVSPSCDGLDLNSGDIDMQACFSGNNAGYTINHCPNNSSKSHKLRNIIIISCVALICVCIVGCILCNQCKKRMTTPDYQLTQY